MKPLILAAVAIAAAAFSTRKGQRATVHIKETPKAYNVWTDLREFVSFPKDLASDGYDRSDAYGSAHDDAARRYEALQQAGLTPSEAGWTYYEPYSED